MEEAYDVAVEALEFARALYTITGSQGRTNTLIELLEQLVTMLAP